jgi:hypothetical protein
VEKREDLPDQADYKEGNTVKGEKIRENEVLVQRKENENLIIKS